MIWEFWQYEKYHGKKATAYDPQLNGANREYAFVNDPQNQRKCKCQKCGTKIPREVPRIKLVGAYYYGSGYYCLSCGVRLLEKKQEEFKDVNKELNDQIKSLDEILDISDKVMKDEWYSKKMSLERLIQVVKGEDT